MRPFRLVPSIQRGQYGGLYLRIGRTRRMLHIGNWGRLLGVWEGKS